MQLPYRFPDSLEQAARRADEFQRLPRETRWREIAALMELGLAMTRASGQRDWIEQRLAEQEAQWQRSQQELFARAMSDDHPISMQDLLDGVATAAAAMEQHGVSYALIGGMATGYRSQPRFTKDLDFLLRIPQVALPGLLETLEGQGYQFDQTTTIREWIEHHMVVLSYHGIRVDWLKAVIPAYQHILDRATEETWLGQRIRVASAEGLILMKLLAARTQDWLDIENLVAAQRGKLDMNWICTEWQTLADSDDPRMARLLELVARAREMS